MNAHPSDPYRFRARTAEEIKQSEHLVPGMNPADLPPPDDSVLVVPPKTTIHLGTMQVPAEPRLPPPSAQKAADGWLL